MPALIYIGLIGWIPVCLIMFMMLPQRQAMLIGILGGWLFLPPMSLGISGLPDYSKTSALSYGILLSLMIFGPDRFMRFRPSWRDLPIICCTLGAFVTSLSNDLGAYDGLASMNGVVTYYGLPYLIGRIGFDSPRDLRSLAIAVVVGGLVYVPFCFVEMGVGPILTSKIYGVFTFMEIRLGGYRPHVFLTNGLELGLWMSICSLIGIWLWLSKSVDQIGGIPFGPVLLPILVLTTVFCRSSGALVLMGVSLAVMWASMLLNRRLIMYLWVLTCFLYMGVRIANLWDYSQLITFLNQNFDADRAQSLEFRFQNEDILIEKALQRPILGWGGFGRSRVFDEYGKDVSITDGMWIISLGVNGFVGVISLLMMPVLPSLLIIAKYPPREWKRPDVGPIIALVGGIATYLGDILLNGFPNSVVIVAAGALTTVVQSRVYELGAAAGFEDDGRWSKREAPSPEALTAEERLADRYVEMARGLRAAGDYEGAAVSRRHAFDLFSGLVGVGRERPGSRRRRLDCANDLAWLLAVRPDPAPGDREEAVDLARVATEGDPDSPTYWNTLGLTLCRVGAFEEAQAAARRSMQLDEAWNGFDLVVLALADARLGRKADAAPWLAQAIRWRDDQGSSDPILNELIHETESALVG